MVAILASVAAPRFTADAQQVETLRAENVQVLLQESLGQWQQEHPKQKRPDSLEVLVKTSNQLQGELRQLSSTELSGCSVQGNVLACPNTFQNISATYTYWPNSGKVLTTLKKKP